MNYCIIYKLVFVLISLINFSTHVSGGCALLEIADCPLLTSFCPESAVCGKESVYRRFEDGTCCCEPINRCGPNERYQECGSGCGDLTCTLRNLTGVACPEVCRTGCFCIEGFVRNIIGECIPVEQCDARVCKDHEEFKECGCPDANCGDPKSTGKCNDCLPNCYCQEGFVRDWNYDCIPENECKTCQNPNEHFVPCSKLCEGNCENPFAKDCPTDACVPGCVCDFGFVRGYNDTCIPVSQCFPLVCDEHRHFSECGANICQATCDSPDLPTRCKPGRCVPGCICDDGYVLNEEGICIELEQCKKCDEHEIFTCGCSDRRCDAPDDVVECLFCSLFGCFCKEGHFRDAEGKCVPWSQCN